MNQDTKVRALILIPKAGVSATIDDSNFASTGEVFPCKEFSITDDVLNISDSACFTIANTDGKSAQKIKPGHLIKFFVSDPEVAGGRFTQHMTGRVINVRTGSGPGGSQITVNAMDLGWHLTSCHGVPLTPFNGVTFKTLLERLIDPSWGFGPVVLGNIANTLIKQGRTGALRAAEIGTTVGQVFPPIQVEPGQAPFEIIQQYAQRSGVLVNVGAKGELIFFAPTYVGRPSYEINYREGIGSNENNVIGSPSLTETIDGVYSSVQCWSTKLDHFGNETENPNAQYTHNIFYAHPNPLPFFRRFVFSDSDAINKALRLKRAAYKQTMGRFDSWSYECELQGISQNGSFFTSNAIVDLNDHVNGVFGLHYVQSVQRSFTEAGTRTKLLIKQPILDPAQNALNYGGGTKRTKKKAAVVSASVTPSAAEKQANQAIPNQSIDPGTNQSGG